MVSTPQFHVWILYKHLDQYHQALAFHYFMEILINRTLYLRMKTVSQTHLFKKKD